MTNLIIPIVLLGLVFVLLNRITDRVKKDAYKWWYLPWFALIYSGLMYLVYNKTDVPDWSFIQRWLYEEYQVEAVYSLACMVLWMLLRLILRSDSIHEKLIKPFRNVFAKQRDDKEQVLPFPYFIDDEGVVRAKVGQVFYRWTMKCFVVILALVYAIFFLLLRFNAISEFYLISALGIFGLLPLIEYYIYLCAEVPVEDEIVDKEPKGRSDFDELWQLYVSTFDNYSVAWKKTNTEDELKLARDWEKDNDDDIENLMKEFMDMTKCSDAIIEKYDIVTAFMKLEPVFDHVEKNGRHILIALDIPNHFTQGQEQSYTDDIAAALTKILRKSFYIYNKKSSQAALANSIVISSLSILSRQGMNEEWLRKIGLIVVVNVFDKGVSNMYECRKFCYILQSVNQDYQLVFVTPHRRDMEPSLRNTWLTGTNMPEKRMRQFPKGARQFFIGYDFEDFRERFHKILTASPTEPLYSGSEMAPIALSSRIGDKEKVVTPVHYLDLAYSNAIEGKEELGRFYDLISKFYRVSTKNINDNMSNHLLPVDHFVDEQIFSVIYDVDNNAPAMYSKWLHLGYGENFSIVISKPYLFRDYFNANHDYFVIAPFAAIQPHLCKSRLTLAIILLNMLQKAEMEEKTLREMLRYYYNEKEIISVSELIKDLFKTYFSNNLASMLMTKDEVVFDGEKYSHLIKYNLFQLTDSNVPSYLDIVEVKDESGNVLLDILADLMYQNYDKGQIHSFSGRPYMIKDFDATTKTLNVSSVNNSSNDILFYKPAQRVAISKERIPIEGINGKPVRWRHPITGEYLSVAFEGFDTLVRVNTVDLYEFYKYDIKGFRVTESSSPERRYPNGKVLKITFGFLRKPEYLKRIDDIRKSLQTLLYEAMQSVFPHHSQYLIISSIGNGDEELPWIFNQFECSDQVVDGELSYYFIEDAHIDLGLIGALAADKQNIWYVFRYIYDYLIWLTEGSKQDMPIEEGERCLFDIANWKPTVYDQYLERENFDKLSFLKYGREELPSYFDINLMINFIKDLFEDDSELKKVNTERQTKNDVIGTCDFCGEKFKNGDMQRLDDGRMRCAECSEGAIDTEQQFNEMVEKVRNAFLTHLGINFSGIVYNAKLVSAVELHKLGGYQFSITNGYDVRELIGLACDRKLDEFYVENGYKPDKTFGIIAHEMTHIWEYNNDNFKRVRQTNEDLVEGLAVWTDLFLSEKNGATNIEAHRNSWLARDDKYGQGLRFIMENCPEDPYGYIREKAKTL